MKATEREKGQTTGKKAFGKLKKRVERFSLLEVCVFDFKAH